MTSFSYRRIVVAGTCGSGKTTLANLLAKRFDIPHIELDRHFWHPGWVSRSNEELRAQVEPQVEKARWVVDGNYSKLHDLIWTRAECVIWLDYPLPLILWRLGRRTVVNCLQKRELCNGNYECLRLQLFSRQSIFLFAVTSHLRRKRKLRASLERYPHLELIRFRLPGMANSFINRLNEGSDLSLSDGGKTSGSRAP